MLELSDTYAQLFLVYIHVSRFFVLRGELDIFEIMESMKYWKELDMCKKKKKYII